MDFSKTTLPNGLRLITVPMPDVRSATLMILVNAGSRYEEERVNGITHFLEHMLFKGTKKRPTAKMLSEVIDEIGGEWNGSTGKETCAYYIKSAAHNLPKAYDILCDMLTGSILDSKEIEREKGVIKSEIAMYEDMPPRRVGEIFEELLYPDASLGWDIAGTPASVDRVKREDFAKLYSEVYVPENMVVVVTGGVDEEEVKGLTGKYLGELEESLKNREHSLEDAEDMGHRERQVFIQDGPRVMLREKKTDQAHMVLGVRGNPRGHKDRWTEEVLATILGGGMSSRLWIAVRERRGLAYYVRADVEHYEDNGYFAVSAGVDPEKIDQAIKVILSELKKISNSKFKISNKELRKAKEYIKGHMFLGLEDTRAVAAYLGTFELLEDKIITPDEVADQIDRVTGEDVVRAANNFFIEDKLNLAIIGPYENPERFRKLLRI